MKNTTKDIEIIKDFLTKKIYDFKNNKGIICKNKYGLNENSKCPLGVLSLLIDINKISLNDYPKIIPQIIFDHIPVIIDEQFVYSFTAGFDGNSFNTNWHTNKDAFDLGVYFKNIL